MKLRNKFPILFALIDSLCSQSVVAPKRVLHMLRERFFVSIGEIPACTPTNNVGLDEVHHHAGTDLVMVSGGVVLAHIVHPIGHAARCCSFGRHLRHERIFAGARSETTNTEPFFRDRLYLLRFAPSAVFGVCSLKPFLPSRFVPNLAFRRQLPEARRYHLLKDAEVQGVHQVKKDTKIQKQIISKSGLM